MKLRAFVFTFTLPVSAVAQSTQDQIAKAVLPLPAAAQGAATVLGYRSGSDELTTLRAGDGDFVCLADQPGNDRFHVSCYHESLAPYMARGRELRATEGLMGEASIRRRWEEIDAGTLPMPDQPAALYQLIGPNPPAGAVPDIDDLNRLTVIYMPYATAEETGFPARPTPGVPWMMYSGRPTAHLMISN